MKSNTHDRILLEHYLRYHDPHSGLWGALLVESGLPEHKHCVRASGHVETKSRFIDGERLCAPRHISDICQS